MSRNVEITKDPSTGLYNVNPNASVGITSIDATVPTFGVDGSVTPCFIAVDSSRNIISELSELENATMILDVSSGGGNARSCYRIDDSSVWDEDAEYSLSYASNCTFELSGSDFIIHASSDITTENIIAKQTPLAYISVGIVGS